MRINYDKQADAMYIRFSESKYYQSDEVKDGIILDFDKKGKIVGMEVLDVSQRLPRESMSSIHFEIDPLMRKNGR